VAQRLRIDLGRWRLRAGSTPGGGERRCGGCSGCGSTAGGGGCGLGRPWAAAGGGAETMAAAGRPQAQRLWWLRVNLKWRRRLQIDPEQCSDGTLIPNGGGSTMTVSGRGGGPPSSPIQRRRWRPSPLPHSMAQIVARVAGGHFSFFLNGHVPSASTG
jgi:hypothetical protein